MSAELDKLNELNIEEVNKALDAVNQQAAQARATAKMIAKIRERKISAERLVRTKTPGDLKTELESGVYSDTMEKDLMIELKAQGHLQPTDAA